VAPRLKDAIFWAIPASVAVVAAVLAYRAFKGGHEEPSREPPALKISLCDAGRYLCRKGEVMATTGEELPEGAANANKDGHDRCVRRKVGPCVKACVADDVTLAGIDDALAKTQLCDLPEYVNVYVRDERNLLGMPAADAGTCEADGFGPTPDGIEQCILRSVSDPNALGVIVATAKCRLGAVPTVDRRPRLVSRAQAIALWCRRDAAAAAALETGPVDLGIEWTDGALDDATDAADVSDAADAVDAG
jgi:hypothetical protein